MNKVSANEQVFPLVSIGQCPIGHLVSPLMSTTSTLSAVNNVRCQPRPLSTMSMLSTMSAVNNVNRVNDVNDVKTPNPAAFGGVSGGRPPAAAFSRSSAFGGV
jgi:hypothetical protein